jgi:hypothetical protein
MVIGPDFWDDVGQNEGCYEGGRLEETSVLKGRLQKTLNFLKENKRPYWEVVVKEHREFMDSIENDTSHCCINTLKFALEAYAQTHGGAYPAGEATPEASLSLLHREGYVDADTLCGGQVPAARVRRILESGGLLAPDSCGWHYVDGLRNDDRQSIALLWAKTGLGHSGERRKDKGTQVLFVDGRVDWVPAFPEEKWSSFVDDQEHLMFDNRQQLNGAAPVLAISLQFPDGRMVDKHHGSFVRISRFQLADGTSWSNILNQPKLEPPYLRWFRCPVTNGVMRVSLDMDTHHLVSDTGTVRFQNGNAIPSNIVLHMRQVPCTHK